MLVVYYNTIIFRTIFKFSFFLSFFFQIRLVNIYTNHCKASLKTLQRVSKCPTNITTYEEAVKQKNCSALSVEAGSCVSFQYHCVLNEDLQFLVEICAPSIIITGTTFLFITCTSPELKDQASFSDRMSSVYLSLSLCKFFTYTSSPPKQLDRANFNQTCHKASLRKEDESLFKWRDCPFPRGDNNEKTKVYTNVWTKFKIFLGSTWPISTRHF